MPFSNLGCSRLHCLSGVAVLNGLADAEQIRKLIADASVRGQQSAKVALTDSAGYHDGAGGLIGLRPMALATGRERKCKAFGDRRHWWALSATLLTLTRSAGTLFYFAPAASKAGTGRDDKAFIPDRAAE